MIHAISTTGRRYRLRYDGDQFLPPFGTQRQFTALEAIPGVAPRFGTTYGESLRRAGYAVEMTARAEYSIGQEAA